MGMPVVSVASGGLPVVDVSGSLRGMPVTEVASGIGVRVTKVAAYGMPVVYETIGVAPSFAKWSRTDSFQVTFSNGDLSVAANALPNAGARAGRGVGAGKQYFEVTMTPWAAGFTGVGVSLAGASFRPATDGTPSAAVLFLGGAISINNTTVGNLGGQGSGNIIGVAVDRTANLIWFRVAPAGNWNASGTANPATGVGGFSISAIAGALFPYFTAANTTEAATANFGASAFSGAVPAGFTAGWPA
jgi:hypothetical protein